MRTFVLTRLRNPGTKAEQSDAPKFDPNEHLRGNLSMFKGGDDYEVLIDFERWAAI